MLALIWIFGESNPASLPKSTYYKTGWLQLGNFVMVKVRYSTEPVMSRA
jgi:hypothetical protein